MMRMMRQSVLHPHPPPSLYTSPTLSLILCVIITWYVIDLYFHVIKLHFPSLSVIKRKIATVQLLMRLKCMSTHTLFYFYFLLSHKEEVAASNIMLLLIVFCEGAGCNIYYYAFSYHTSVLFPHSSFFCAWVHTVLSRFSFYNTLFLVWCA